MISTGIRSTYERFGVKEVNILPLASWLRDYYGKVKDKFTSPFNLLFEMISRNGLSKF